MSTRLTIVSLVAATAFFLMPFSFNQATETLSLPRTIALCPAALAAQAPGTQVTASGTVRRRGFTSYMYGTHLLVDRRGHTLYALKSDSIRLDRYIGKEVTVSGKLVEGYPLEGGPPFLNVVSVSP